MKCKDCKYMEYLKRGNRHAVYCKHPNQDYINDYCNKHRVVAMPGFICFTKLFSFELRTKTSPKWCPLRKEEQK